MFSIGIASAGECDYWVDDVIYIKYTWEDAKGKPKEVIAEVFVYSPGEPFHYMHGYSLPFDDVPCK